MRNIWIQQHSASMPSKSNGHIPSDRANNQSSHTIRRLFLFGFYHHVGRACQTEGKQNDEERRRLIEDIVESCQISPNCLHRQSDSSYHVCCILMWDPALNIEVDASDVSRLNCFTRHWLAGETLNALMCIWHRIVNTRPK